MHPRTLLLGALSAVALLCTGASGASGATLFTSPAHTTRVSVGATASLSATSPFTFTSGASTIFACSASTLNLSITQNTSAEVVGTVTSGTWTGCPFVLTGTFPWKATVRGSSAVSGSDTVWTNTTVRDFSFDVQGGRYIATYQDTHFSTHWVTDGGTRTTTVIPTVATTNALTGAAGSPPTNGVYWRQPTTASAPLCLVLDHAGDVSGPLTGNGKIDTSYCFEGTATTWSLTN